jgi:hypothetical protein
MLVLRLGEVAELGDGWSILLTCTRDPILRDFDDECSGNGLRGVGLS